MTHSGPEALFKTCVAMKFVDDDGDDDAVPRIHDLAVFAWCLAEGERIGDECHLIGLYSSYRISCINTDIRASRYIPVCAFMHLQRSNFS